ncbi:hypothetical protein BASA83_003181 [Batrachochytrium salamandrivorans]|nr:hypothetical protein BASA83_003181 [Batrachochytrium salamandrivorans]
MTSYSTQGIFLYSEQPARNSFDPTKIPTSPYSRSITSTDAADTDEGVSKKIAHKRSPPLSIPSHKRVKATTAELTSTSAQTAMTINSIYQNTTLQKQSLLSNHTVSTAALVAESTASSFVHAHDKDALRRVVHCAVERDRRERIKVKLDELKAAIPACAGMDTTQKLVFTKMRSSTSKA